MKIPFLKSMMTLVVVSVFCFSCSKKADPVSNLASQKASEILAMDNTISQQAAFRILSPHEKSVLWKTYLGYQLENYAAEPEKLAFIKSVINQINDDFFDEAKSTNYAGMLAEIKYTATKLFSKEELVRVFASFNKKNISSSASQEEISMRAGGDPPCSCSTTQLNTCINPTPLCNTAGCRYSSFGCGFFGIYACNGLCTS